MQLVNVVGTPVCCHVRGDWHGKATTRRVPLSPGTVNLDGKRATGGVCTLHQRPPTSSPKPQVTSQSRCTTPHCFSNIPCPFLHTRLLHLSAQHCIMFVATLRRTSKTSFDTDTSVFVQRFINNLQGNML